MSQLPVLALIGRPNVGKSTLFNILTGERNALVANLPGLTRDRIYGKGSLGDQPFLVIDTAGLVPYPEAGIEALMAQQTQQALLESDYILFIVDARAGLLPQDQLLADRLRKLGKPCQLVVNKIDGLASEAAIHEFFALGLGTPIGIAAAQNSGVEALIERILAQLPKSVDTVSETTQAIRVAMIGRPNVGKSTLINRILNEERVLVFDEPGTTRDSISIPFQCQSQDYILIDTAGVRRRKKVSESLEKLSVIKTFQSIERTDVAVLVLDAQAAQMTDQDLNLLNMIITAGSSLVIAINKSDQLSAIEQRQLSLELKGKLEFLDFIRIHFISALEGKGIQTLFKLIQEAYQSARKTLVTSDLNRWLEQAIEAHAPPAIKGHRVKLRYAHAGGHAPLKIIIHGRRVNQLPKSYQKYLLRFFQNKLNLWGAPLHIFYKENIEK